MEVVPENGLVETPLKCGACGAVQQWALPEDDKLQEILRVLGCVACKRLKLYFAPNTRPRPAP